MEFGQFELTRYCFQRALAFIYLIAFVIAFRQFTPLVGEQGLLPIRFYLQRLRFWDAPSLFWLRHDDKTTRLVAFLGIVLSFLALSGFSDQFGLALSVTVWALLWIFYLSFVNVGQVFYGFGWETLLLETGFLAIFLGPRYSANPVIVIWLLRWLLFRLMFGAGMIKLRGDRCWRDLTCMFYHYETQPLPNPLSLYFHRLPKFIHKTGVLFTHFVELVVPWFYFLPGTPGIVAGLLTMAFQITLIFSGNLSWLNYMTLVISIACFDDAFLLKFFPWFSLAHSAPSVFSQIVWWLLAAFIVVLSIRPAKNLFVRRQLMNASFDPLHLVNTYGAFGSITRERYEIILEGTSDAVVTWDSVWKEYEFKAKPGNPKRRPPLLSPYHHKIDWQMWFAAMSSYHYHPWLLKLVAKLLEGDQATLKLMGKNPFPDAPPKFIRAGLYLYRFPKQGEENGEWWKRVRVAEYLPALGLRHFSVEK